MKLFITNKSEFEHHFSGCIDTYTYLTTKEIHQKAFNILLSSISEGSIPTHILAPYKRDKNRDGDAIFVFKTKKEDVYFYEFETTII